MGIEYNYITGYTDILLGNTTISEVNYDFFDSDILQDDVIQKILRKEGYTGDITKDQTKFGNFLLEWSEDKTSAKLYKNITYTGYIFNQTKKIFIYSFFYTRVYNKGFFPCINFDDEILEEEQQVIVEPVPVTAIDNDFLTELKSKFKNREPIDLEPKEKEVEKTEFLIDLEKEIDLRKQRAKKREKKLAAKRRKRESKTT